jgi:hypothetical protein
MASSNCVRCAVARSWVTGVKRIFLDQETNCVRCAIDQELFLDQETNCVRCAIGQEISAHHQKLLRILDCIDEEDDIDEEENSAQVARQTHLEEKFAALVARQKLFSEAEMETFMKDVRKAFGIDDE